jgi:hypothetical protein
MMTRARQAVDRYVPVGDGALELERGRESNLEMHWSEVMNLKMNVRKGSVSICFTDLCNCKLVREPIANFYWSKG